MMAIFKKQIIYTIIYCILFTIATYLITPLLEDQGMNSFYAYSLSMNICFSIMLVHGIIGMKKRQKDKKLLISASYKKIKMKNTPWIIGIFALEMGLFILFGFIHKWSNSWMIYPESTPLFNLPNIDYITILDQEIGIFRNYWLLIITLITLLMNVIGEEFFWRGYLMGEQLEKEQSNKVWIIHGLLWTLFHSFKYYDLIIIFPVCMGLSFIVYKTRNNSNGLLYHFLTNGTTLVSFTILVLRGL